LKKKNEYGKALDAFQKVLLLDSNNTYALDRVGLLHFNSGNEQEAIKYFDRSLAIAPCNIMTLNNKGLAVGIWLLVS
jgi:tetratricopeptide (TPR) repeat protein